ncbi:MAG: DUF3109 family protein [Saprospiraceae bacterium]|nr:DUF3109 family protein [Saprospiraceae bacterium]
MHLIENILVSDDILTAAFACDLEACKGACCWEGDYGAPLDPEEIETLKAILPEIQDFLSPAGLAVIQSKGTSVYYQDLNKEGTPLIDGGPCAYMRFDSQGVAQCGIEKAWEAGETQFRKPISCHLYPIRVLGRPEEGFEALNYERWEICSAACHRGEQTRMPLYVFAREALIRKYGPSFYDALQAAALHLTEESTE